MNYPGKEQDFIKFLDNNPSIKEQISAPIFENKVFDHIVKLIKKLIKIFLLSNLKRNLMLICYNFKYFLEGLPYEYISAYGS